MNSSLIEAVARNIRKYKKGLSLAKIAQKARVPVSTIETIYYKRRIKDIKASTLLAIAKALNVSTDDLIR
jgi:transcriptional regulator with XRE-family HTH domain